MMHSDNLLISKVDKDTKVSNEDKKNVQESQSSTVSVAAIQVKEENVSNNTSNKEVNNTSNKDTLNKEESTKEVNTLSKEENDEDDENKDNESEDENECESVDKDLITFTQIDRSNEICYSCKIIDCNGSKCRRRHEDGGGIHCTACNGDEDHYNTPVQRVSRYCIDYIECRGNKCRMHRNDGNGLHCISCYGDDEDD